MIANIEPNNDASTQRMTWEEMKRAFPREWIVIAEPQSDAAQQLVSGRVYWHGGDRSEARRQAETLNQDGMALFYTGPFPKNMTYAL